MFQVKEHWAEFSPLMAAGQEKLAKKKEFVYNDSGEGESEMVVCVRVRPRCVSIFCCFFFVIVSPPLKIHSATF